MRGLGVATGDSSWGGEVGRLRRIVQHAADADGVQLPLGKRIGRAWTRVSFRYWKGDEFSVLRGRSWAVLSCGAFVALNVPLFLWADDWDRWWQALLVGALLLSGFVMASALHKHVLRPSRYRVFQSLAMVALYSVGLGVLFMRGCFPDRVPLLAHLYHSLLLFTGATGAEACQRIPLGLQVAELAGIIVLFAAVLTIIDEVSSGPIARWRASRHPRVILVTGLSDDTLPVIRSLTEDPDGSLIVVIEANPEHPLIPQARRYGARVIKEEITEATKEQRWLRDLCTSRGNHVALRRAYLLSDDEQANLDAADTIREVLAGLDPDHRDEHRAPTRLIVRIDRYRPAHHYLAGQATHWRTGNSARDDVRSGPRVFISTLGHNQVIAHALAEHIAADPPQRLIVVGESDLSHAFRDEWQLQRDSAAFLNSRVTRRDRQPWHEELRRREQLPEPKHWNQMPGLPELRAAIEYARSQRIVVLIAQEPDERERSELETLATDLQGRPVKIFVPTPGVRGLATHPMLGCLHSFGPSLGGAAVAPGNREKSSQPSPLHGVPQDSWFRAAKLVGDSYTINDTPSSWHDLVSTDRDSNFRAAWSLLCWMAELGFTWTWSSEPPEGHQAPSDDLLTLLVPHEHAAWMTFKYDTGWIGFDGASNDKERLLNRFLHPLDQLDDVRRAEATGNTLDNLKGVLQVLAILGFHPVAPEPQRWWRLRRTGRGKVLETLKEPWTWTDENGNELHAEVGDLRIADVVQPGGKERIRSIKPDSFAATHRHLKGNIHQRTGEVTARLAVAGEQIDSQEGPQTPGENSWVLQDALGNQWIITSERLLEGYVWVPGSTS